MDDRFTLLVADDVQTNIDILVEALHADYDISVATEGQGALELIKDSPPDLVLLDIMMPEMDGFEVCEILKKEPAFTNIPVIFLTARTETEDIIRGFELGAADYVTKPFQIPELMARVRTHLELKRNRDLVSRKVADQKEMLHVLCHDLANPLTSIQGVLNLLQDAPAGCILSPWSGKRIFIDFKSPSGRERHCR